MHKTFAALLVSTTIVACGSVARAADWPMPAAPLPTFAQTPAPATNPWSGLYVGSSVIASFGKGAHGFGGGVDVGYQHAFDNHLVLGIEGSAGYMPVAIGHSDLRGFDFMSTGVKLGYDMGRVMPFVTTGLVLAKPEFKTGPAYVTAADSVNDLFNTKGDTKAFATIGGGVDIAVTDRLKVGFSATVGTGRGLLPPPVW